MKQDVPVTPEQKEKYRVALRRVLEFYGIEISPEEYNPADKLSQHNLDHVTLVHIVMDLGEEIGQEMMVDNGFDRLLTLADLEAALASHF